MMKHFNMRARALSFLLSAALLLPAAAVPAATASALSCELPAASSAAASSITVRNDTLGKDISSEPVVYLDNSDAAGGATKTTVTVSLVDSKGRKSVTGDSLVYEVSDLDGCVEVKDITPMGVVTSKTLEICAYSEQSGSETPLNPGTATVSFANTSSSNRITAELVVDVLKPAEDMYVYWNNSEEPLELNDYCPENEAYVNAVAGDAYKLSAEIIPGDSTDEVEWSVFEGDYTGGTGRQTSKASISDDGYFNALETGEVTIVASLAATPTSAREESYGEKTIIDVDDDGETFETQETLKTIPKYIHVSMMKENPAASITLTDYPETLGAGNVYQLYAEMEPLYSGDGYSGATDELHWASSNRNVLTVSNTGLVTAVSTGTAKITVYGNDASIYDEQTIRVVKAAEEMTIDPPQAQTRVGVPVELSVTLSPTDAEDEILWDVSDPDIIEVSPIENESGLCFKALATGLSEGTAYVTVTALNSGLSEDITVEVGARIESDEMSVSYTIDQGKSNSDAQPVSIFEGATVDLYTKNRMQIDASLISTDGSESDDTIEWTINNSNECISVLSKDAKSLTIIGSAPGTASVKAYASSDPSLSRSFYIQVLKACTSVNLYEADGKKSFPSSKSMNVGSMISIVADLVTDGNSPHQHSDKIVNWESSDPGIVQVDQNGTVRAVANGEAFITVTAASGIQAKTKIRVFTVSEVIIQNATIAEDGSLPYIEMLVDEGFNSKKSLGVTVKDEKGNSVQNVDVEWKSLDESVARVDSSGNVSSAGLGAATITATCGNRSDQCRAIVYTKMVFAKAEDMPVQVFSPIKTSYEPKPKLTFAGKTLTEGTDYTVSYENNTAVGSGARAILTGKGNFRETKTVTFSIDRKPLTDPEIAYSPIQTYGYTGESFEPKPEVTCSFILLTEDVDYTISYKNNRDPGTATVRVSGKGNYKGSLDIPFEIFCDHIFESDLKVIKQPTCAEPGIKEGYCTVCRNTVQVEIPALPHTFGDPVTIAPTTSSEGYDLHTCEVCGYSYKDNIKERLPGIKISDCSATINGKNFPYEGSPVVPVISIIYNGKTLTENTDYTLTYLNNTAIGTGYILVTGIGEYTGMGKITFNITNGISDADSAAPKEIELSELDDESNAEDGRISIATDDVQVLKPVTYSPLQAPYEPKPAANAGDNALIENVDYIITYANNDKIGTATITMTGIGKYKGTAKFQFDILPRSFRDGTITVRAMDEQSYTGKALTPSPIVVFEGYILSNGTDYSVTYKNNIKPGMATATITGIGNYCDSIDLNFAIDCSHEFEDTYDPVTGLSVRKCRICGETEGNASSGIMGDVTGDGTIAADDALEALRFTVGLTELSKLQLVLADVDFDSNVTANDSLAILRYSIGLAAKDSPIGKAPNNSAAVK